jgi:hypothetical protein
MTHMTTLPELTTERLGFHPKRFLKDLQQRFSSSQYSYLIFCFLVPVILIALAYVVLYVYLVMQAFTVGVTYNVYKQNL